VIANPALESFPATAQGAALAQLIERKVDDRRGAKRKHLRDNEADDDCDPERPPQLGTHAGRY
jgi:hypothetical protein